MMKTTRLATLAAVLMIAAGCSGGDDDDNQTIDGGNGMGTDGNVAGQIGVTGISPDHGPLAGGTSVTISGFGFLSFDAGTNMVLLGGVLAGDVTVVDDSTITATTPAGAADGLVGATVFNSNGFIAAADVYSYNPLPTLSLANPDFGGHRGGDRITLTGTGFEVLEAGTNTVDFAGAAGTNVNVVDDTTLEVDSPAGMAFTQADIAVSNDNGDTGPATFAFRGSGLIGFDSGWQAGGRVYFIDTVTGTSIQIGQMQDNGFAIGVTAAAFGPDATLYILSGRNFGPQTLYTYDCVAGEATRIAEVTNPSIANGGGGLGCSDITFDGATVYCQDRRELFTLDLATAELTLIGADVSSLPGDGIAIDPADATLYNGAARELYTVDKSTGLRSTTPITLTMTEGGDRVNAMAFYQGTMYVNSRVTAGKGGATTGNTFSVNPATGATTLVTTIMRNIDALAATPW